MTGKNTAFNSGTSSKKWKWSNITDGFLQNEHKRFTKRNKKLLKPTF